MSFPILFCVFLFRRLALISLACFFFPSKNFLIPRNKHHQTKSPLFCHILSLFVFCSYSDIVPTMDSFNQTVELAGSSHTNQIFNFLTSNKQINYFYQLYLSASWIQIVIASVVLILSYDQVKYQLNKGSIAGPKLKIWPIIGPFLESLDPKFEEYKAKWDSGALSCVSIFHKFVVIASTRDLARRFCRHQNMSNLVLLMSLSRY